MEDPQNNQTNAPDREMTRQIVDRLNQQTEELDGATLSRLAQGRNAALDQLGGGRATPRWLNIRRVESWALVAVLAMALGLGVLLGPQTFNESADNGLPEGLLAGSDAGLDQLADLELLAADDPELFADLDFIAWMDQSDLESGVLEGSLPEAVPSPANSISGEHAG
ncbi:MAG: hypothetical protein P1U54_12735 [Immundisolibacteraceae bacterium]|nr:hypothetical protein [Immundisolibacteraceae bacterium]